MNEHVVIYDLYSPGQNYKILTEKLKKYPCYVHLQRSVWVIQTSETVEQVERKLSSCLDSNDRLFVAYDKIWLC